MSIMLKDFGICNNSFVAGCFPFHLNNGLSINVVKILLFSYCFTLSEISCKRSLFRYYMQTCMSADN